MEIINKKSWAGTKKQYLEKFPNGTDRPVYIVDMPNNEISNSDMELAITTERIFYENKQIFICKDDGNYLKGHIYQLNIDENGYFWIDITSSSGNGTLIEPNPSDEATETLNTIKIGDIVYSIVGSGTNNNIFKLLWENPSPTSDFAEQDVNIDLNGYEFLMIEFKIVTTDVLYDTTILKNDVDLGFYLQWSQSYTNRNYSRSGSIITSGLHFNNAAIGNNSGNSTSNNAIIPNRIYGIKNTSGDGSLVSKTISTMIPSNNYVDLEFVNEQEYTAPDNGWFYIEGTTTAFNYPNVALINLTKNYQTMGSFHYSPATISALLPVAKNDIVKPFAGSTNVTIFKFIYAETIEDSGISSENSLLIDYTFSEAISEIEFNDINLENGVYNIYCQILPVSTSNNDLHLTLGDITSYNIYGYASNNTNDVTTDNKINNSEIPGGYASSNTIYLTSHIIINITDTLINYEVYSYNVKTSDPTFRLLGGYCEKQNINKIRFEFANIFNINSNIKIYKNNNGVH